MRIPDFPSGKNSKYAPLAEMHLTGLQAQAVVLLVIGGKLGPGMAVSTQDPSVVKILPKLLRIVADDIEQQNAQAAQQ